MNGQGWVWAGLSAAAEIQHKFFRESDAATAAEFPGLPVAARVTGPCDCNAGPDGLYSPQPALS